MSPPPKKNNFIVIILSLVIIGGLGFAGMKMLRGGSAGNVKTGGAPVVEVPRTETPMAQYTRFFKKKQFTLPEDNRTLTYYWFEPAGRPYPPGLSFPLVVILHGAPGNAYAAEYLITQKMQLDYPAFILVPMSPAGKIWAVPDTMNGKDVDRKYLDNQSLPDAVALVRDMAKNNPVDTSRIYILGCSDGGGGAYGAATRYSNIFAAAVPISGLWDPLGGGALRTATWIVHGALDAGMPIANTRALAAGAKAAGAPVVFTEIPDMGHECSNPRLYTRALWQWLFAHRKK